jgi:hypothetical protein
MIVACAFLTRPWGIGLGWILQLVLILTGIFEPAMFLVGALFAAAWWYGIRTGIRLDREAGERAREQAAWEAAHPDGSGPGQQPQSP